MTAEWTGPLLDHLWQSTGFSAACTLLALALRRREARVRTTLWSAAILKFLVPWPALAALGAVLNVWSRADIPPARPNGAFYADVLTQPFTLARFAPPESATAPQADAWSTDRLLAAAIAIWAAGALLLVARWALRWMRLRRVVRRAEPAGSGRELDVFRRAQQRDPRYAHVTLALTDEPIGPGVAGSVWPVVLWPRAMSVLLSDEEMASVFAHELCHVQRRDNLVSAFCRAVEAVFWFHPAVWVLGSRLQDGRERACDEGVLAGVPPDVYAEALVKTCQFHLEAPLACAAAGTRATFTGRIAHILHSGASRPVAPWVRRGLAGMVAGGLSLPVAVAAVMPPNIVGLGPHRLLQSPQLLVAWAPRGSVSVAHGDERFVSESLWPSEAGAAPGGLQAFGGGRLAGTAVSPAEIIRTAYGGAKSLRFYEVVGLPEWAHRERFDLRARAARVRAGARRRLARARPVAERPDVLAPRRRAGAGHSRPPRDVVPLAVPAQGGHRGGVDGVVGRRRRRAHDASTSRRRSHGAGRRLRHRVGGTRARRAAGVFARDAAGAHARASRAAARSPGRGSHRASTRQTVTVKERT